MGLRSACVVCNVLRMETETTAPVYAPTWGVIPAGTTVTVEQRLPGLFQIKEGRRTSKLMSAEQVAAVTLLTAEQVAR